MVSEQEAEQADFLCCGGLGDLVRLANRKASQIETRKCERKIAMIRPFYQRSLQERVEDGEGVIDVLEGYGFLEEYNNAEADYDDEGGNGDEDDDYEEDEDDDNEEEEEEEEEDEDEEDEDDEDYDDDDEADSDKDDYEY